MDDSVQTDAIRPALTQLRIRNYRSIGPEWVDISIPTRRPLVLLGENNAGKSNILRALNLVLGDYWPGNHQPEDHEVFGRDFDSAAITIQARFAHLPCRTGCASTVSQMRWNYDKDAEQPTQFGFETDRCDHWPNNEVRRRLSCMTVGGDRSLSYQMSYASKFTSLSRLMHRFHERLTEDDDRVGRLKQLFDSLVETFDGVPEFSSFRESLRRSSADFGGNLRYGLDIDFSAYDASNFFRSLQIFPQLDGAARTYDEMGSGQQQILGLAFSYAYAQAFSEDGLILCVEEPETNLHPLAQSWLQRRLQEVVAAGVQVIMTTHSPAFIDLAWPGSNVLVRKIDEGSATTVKQVRASELAQQCRTSGVPDDRINEDNVGPFYENSATQEIKAGLFARAIVLVEGQTEALALPVILEQLGLDTTREGIAVVPVDGAPNLAKWVRFFDSHEIPVLVVTDTDSDKGGERRKSAARAQRDLALALSLEDFPSAGAESLEVFGRLVTMNPYFEESMRDVFTEYSGLEDSAAQMLGHGSKPLIARHASRELVKLHPDSPGWVSLRPLADAVRGLIAHPTDC